MLLAIDVVLLAVAGLASMILILRGREARRRAEARNQVVLAESGIQASGNLLGASEARFPDGVTVALTNGGFHTRPGDSVLIPDLCMARIAVPLADQIVCKASEAGRLVGALPAVPRVRTGYARFDDAYAVFVGVSGGRPAGSYRAALAEGDTPWAQAPVLDGFLDLDLRWMWVHEGMADLVFPELAIEDALRAMTLAHAVERAAGGKPVRAIVRGPRITLWDVDKKMVRACAASVLPGCVAGAVLGPAGGLLVGLLIVLGFLVWLLKKSGQPT